MSFKFRWFSQPRENFGHKSWSNWLFLFKFVVGIRIIMAKISLNVSYFNRQFKNLTKWIQIHQNRLQSIKNKLKPIKNDKIHQNSCRFWLFDCLIDILIRNESQSIRFYLKLNKFNWKKNWNPVDLMENVSKSIENQNCLSDIDFKIQIVVESSSEFVRIWFWIVDDAIWDA